MTPLNNNREQALAPLIQYIENCLANEKNIQLNFICTHNSRRSQFAQVWALHYANQNGITIHCFSGGTEVTACNKRTIESLRSSGFEIIKKIESDNPLYEIIIGDKMHPLFSKLYNDISSPKNEFAAIMTCSHAEQNCPFIIGAEKRISIPYEDPKEFDNTSVEAKKYDERSLQIAEEMEYVFKKIKESLQ